MNDDRLNRDEEEARLFLPPETLPDGLAPTGRLVQGIRERLDRRNALAARRNRLLCAAGGAAALAVLAAALAFCTVRARCGGGGEATAAVPGPSRAPSADAPILVAGAEGEEAAFREYDEVFGADPNEAAFERLDDLIVALEYDFSAPEWQDL